ncbi:hypothetical protein KPH14_009362 [Odynerus spinipes]|uniref:Uncharacterized protein n=1 Tax=Odynerus spinipes TaxID=1348599 RepID=A0AAD9VRE7_9HYME|nr:hypothetical protein KPH14_009362 [Odynerus spinipes]
MKIVALRRRNPRKPIDKRDNDVINDPNLTVSMLTFTVVPPRYKYMELKEYLYFIENRITLRLFNNYNTAQGFLENQPFYDRASFYVKWLFLGRLDGSSEKCRPSPTVERLILQKKIKCDRFILR